MELPKPGETWAYTDYAHDHSVTLVEVEEIWRSEDTYGTNQSCQWLIVPTNLKGVAAVAWRWRDRKWWRVGLQCAICDSYSGKDDYLCAECRQKKPAI